MSECVEWSGHRNNHGYGMKWWKGGPKKVHRIVFDLYHGYLPKVVRHTCDNPACYNIEHLRGGTMQDNTNDCIERGRFKRNDGEHNPRAKLNADDVAAIKVRLSTGEGCSAIGRAYGVHHSTIYGIKRGVRWKNV